MGRGAGAAAGVGRAAGRLGRDPPKSRKISAAFAFEPFSLDGRRAGMRVRPLRLGEKCSLAPKPSAVFTRTLCAHPHSRPFPYSPTGAALELRRPGPEVRAPLRPFAGTSGGTQAELMTPDRRTPSTSAPLRAPESLEGLGGILNRQDHQGSVRLVQRLMEMGMSETEGSVTVKINRGAVPAWFYFAAMKAIGTHTTRLHEAD
jgi:hypothetical protein